MEKKEIIKLHVKLVPAFDPETRARHDAYTVYCHVGEKYLSSPGWTLRDAVDLFRKLYDIAGHTKICLVRPFVKQRCVREWKEEMR